VIYFSGNHNLTAKRVFMSTNASTTEDQTVRSKNHVGRQAVLYSKSFFKRLFLRKSMGLIQVETDTFNELRRSVTSLQMIGIGIGATIGQ
jgi:hypothetical protein